MIRGNYISVLAILFDFLELGSCPGAIHRLFYAYFCGGAVGVRKCNDLRGGKNEVFLFLCDVASLVQFI